MSCSCVTVQHIGMDCNLQLLLMEIDINEQENTETNKFINFSIREYVDEIRNKNPEKCWPFRSLEDLHKKVVSSYQSSESTFLTEAPNYKIESLGIDNDLGKFVDNGSSELTSYKVNIGQNQHEHNVDEDLNIGHNVSADNNEPEFNRPQRKHFKFRLLSDVYKDPASKPRAGCDRTNPENVNRKFVTESDDELDDDDDVTLAVYFRKQKGVEVTDSSPNKRNIIAVKDPTVDSDRKSNHGSKYAIGTDSNTGISRKKSRTDKTVTQTVQEHNNEVAEKETEDCEMEAVMLLARRFNEEKRILSELETNMTCACVKKKIRKNSTQYCNKPVTKTSSKTASRHRVKKNTKQKLETACCSVQMRSFMPLKDLSSGGFKSQLEMSKMKVVGVEPDAQNCATLVCSFNMNPADFSTPNGENKFMRGV